MKVYQAMANAFIKEGGTTIFGLLGDGQVNWWSEMAKHPDVKIIDARDEGAALSMAEGWTRATGKVGVCSTTQGPGVSRLGTSLVVANRGRYPLVIYTSSVGLNEYKLGQYMDQRKFVEGAEGLYVEVLHANYAEDAVRQAFYRARMESRPVVITVPLNIQDQECEAEGEDYQPSTTLFATQQRIRPDIERLREAVKIISESKKPIVILGKGALWSEAEDVALRLAKRIGAITATSLLGKGLLARDEFFANVSGSYSTKTAHHFFHEADCVIAAGASLNRYTLEGGYLYPNARMIQIDVLRHILTGNYTETADCFLQGDATATLQEIEDMLGKQNYSNTGFRTPDVRQALSQAARDPAEFDIEPGTVDPREVVTMLDKKLPEDVAIVHGSGHQKPFAVQTMMKSRVYHSASNFGAIGQCIGTAIGVGVGANGKPVVMVDGEGSVFQNVQELDTASRIGVNVLFVIMNNEAYGAELYKLIAKGLDRKLSEIRSPDFSLVAKAFGCRGRIARTMDEVNAGIDEFLAKPGPMVLDVRISRNVINIPVRRTFFGQDA